MAPKKAAAVAKDEGETTVVATTDVTSGPAVPHNDAAQGQQSTGEVNKQRLTRFTRPFVASTKKGAPAAVPPRKWRDENNEQQQQQQGESVTADGADNIGNYSNGKYTPILVTKALVEELTGKLGPVDLQRAASKQDPIAPISTEAASLRSKRFHTETPQEAADKRQARFEHDTKQSSNVPQAPSVDADLVAKRQARWGAATAAAAAGGSGGGGGNLSKLTAAKNNNGTSAGVLTDSQKKRLERFGQL